MKYSNLLLLVPLVAWLQTPAATRVHAQGVGPMWREPPTRIDFGEASTRYKEFNSKSANVDQKAVASLLEAARLGLPPRQRWRIFSSQLRTSPTIGARLQSSCRKCGSGNETVSPSQDGEVRTRPTCVCS